MRALFLGALRLKITSEADPFPHNRPAAVSPPTSGLLGSPLLNIDSLTSPRFQNSPLHHSPSFHFGSSPAYNSPHFPNTDIEPEPALEEGDEDEDTGESVSTGDDALDESMFDLDLGGGSSGMDVEGSSESERSRSVGHDSGFGSMKEKPSMGYFARA